MFQNRKTSLQRCFEPDFTRFPAVVFESDDWGACEMAPDDASAAQCLKLLGQPQETASDRLETRACLQALFEVLRKHRGADGMPAVFTAFISMGNPDFAAIESNGFRQYIDIGFDQGFPSPWRADGVLDCMRAGQREGIWEPEYHSLLHHVSPRLWMQLLNSDSREGQLAKALFKLRVYAQGRHIPEYEGYTLPEQNQTIQTGISRFRNAFDRNPQAAVCSDAYPETEMLWAVNGIRTVCLKNCRVNNGEVVVYPNKPWNNQDVYASLGEYQPQLDVVYLTRNAFFELDCSKTCAGNSADELLQVFKRNQSKYNEPSIISSHRINYCSSHPKIRRCRLQELERLTSLLANEKACFLSSHELAQLYRQGWSRRGSILRKWCEGAKVPELAADLYRLPEQTKVLENNLSLGNYLIKERT